MSRTPHWGIIGGGMLGMTLAWELAKAGDHVSIFEAAAEVGGLASAWQLGDIVWDRHYHVTLASDEALRGLLEELGLESDMRWKKTRTNFFWNGRLHPFSGGADFARFPLLNSIEKLRFAASVYRAARLESAVSIEHMTVEEWLTKISGRAVFEKLWQPLLQAKLGDEWRTTSAIFMWATIRRMFAARRSRIQGESFGYLPGGYARILDRFAAALRGKGVCVHTNAVARQVAPVPDGRVEIEFANAVIGRFDRAVITVPCPVTARLCPRLMDREIQLLGGIEYVGIICASLLLRRPLSDSYITNIADANTRLTGVIEMSNLVEPRYFGGRTLVYLPRYVRSDDPAFAQTDKELENELWTALLRIHPRLRRDEVLASRVSRVRYVFARPTPKSIRNLPPVDTSVPGIHILNSAHIVGGTLNVNETVQLAQRHARRLHELAA